MMKRTAVVINKEAGTASSAGQDVIEKISSQFEYHKIKAEFFLTEGSEIKARVRSLIPMGFDIITIAGGDGTLNSGASILSGTEIPMGILPMGTLNHFAKDLDIPLGIEGAVMTIAQGTPQKVDIGEVNGKIFINNSSVGLYPRAVKFRDRHIEKLGGGKWLAMILASLTVFTHFPLFNIKLETDDDSLIRHTPFVFIGNNEYKLDLFNLGKRESIRGGKLSIYTAHCKGRWSMLRIALLALFNRLDQAKNFDLQFTENLRLESRRKVVEVSLDGEVIHMAPPLNYRIRPLELTVILPEKEGENK